MVRLLRCVFGFGARIANSAPARLPNFPMTDSAKRALGSKIQTVHVKTSRRTEWVNISAEVARCVAASGISAGICHIYVPHTTAGVTINEGYDPDVALDMEAAFDRMVPRDAGYKHYEGNSDSHIKATLVGSSQRVLIEGGRLLLGRWQAIFFCEFDGPRNREVHIKIQPDSQASGRQDPRNIGRPLASIRAPAEMAPCRSYCDPGFLCTPGRNVLLSCRPVQFQMRSDVVTLYRAPFLQFPTSSDPADPPNTKQFDGLRSANPLSIPMKVFVKVAGPLEVADEHKGFV